MVHPQQQLQLLPSPYVCSLVMQAMPLTAVVTGANQGEEKSNAATHCHMCTNASSSGRVPAGVHGVSVLATCPPPEPIATCPPPKPLPPAHPLSFFHMLTPLTTLPQASGSKLPAPLRSARARGRC